jgi:inorganic triphosphatase YgiF
VSDAVPRELEAALIARGGEPALARVESLTALGPYALERLTDVRIADTYLDTPAGDLTARGLALRIRDQDHERLLTLKGERRQEAGGSSRLELELPWTPAAVSRIGAQLAAHGVPLPADWGEAAQLGMTVVQRRETRRGRRAVQDQAELAVDRVAYRLDGATARIGQVEIEAKAEGFDLAGAVHALMAAVDGLTPWPYGKLATGQAIAQRLRKGTLALGPDGELEPAGLDAIEGELG